MLEDSSLWALGAERNLETLAQTEADIRTRPLSKGKLLSTDDMTVTSYVNVMSLCRKRFRQGQHGGGGRPLVIKTFLPSYFRTASDAKG